MPGMGKNLIYRSPFYDTSSVHDTDGIAETCHHTERMGDHNNRSSKPGSQVPYQIQDLGLYGHIQGTGGFVGDKNIWIT
jgi:hypothetical protein